MVDAAINHTAVDVKVPEGRPSDYFGKKVFECRKMIFQNTPSLKIKLS